MCLCGHFAFGCRLGPVFKLQKVSVCVDTGCAGLQRSRLFGKTSWASRCNEMPRTYKTVYVGKKRLLQKVGIYARSFDFFLQPVFGLGHGLGRYAVEHGQLTGGEMEGYQATKLAVA